MMKNALMALVVLVFATPVFAQSGSLKVTITGIENTDGIVRIGLYNSKSTFPIFGEEIQGAKVKPTEKGSINYTFEDVVVGIYAVAVWHDENENKEIDKNLFGVPTENYGFSKNIFGIFSAPDFEEVSFKIEYKELLELTINLE